MFTFVLVKIIAFPRHLDSDHPAQYACNDTPFRIYDRFEKMDLEIPMKVLCLC